MDTELPAEFRRNAILASLGTVAATWLESCLAYIELAAGEVLETPDQPPRFLFFPDTALVSFVAHGFDGQRIGIATVGHGGVTGIGLLLGVPEAEYARLVLNGRV